MNKTVMVVMAAFVLALSAGNWSHAQQQAATTDQQQQQGWYCPWRSLNAQGQTASNCPGWGGKGGMGKGGGMHYRCRGGMASQYVPRQGAELTEKDAQGLLQDYLKANNNPNLKLGGISNKDGFYEAEILTKEGSLVDKIQVNKANGWFRSAY